VSVLKQSRLLLPLLVCAAHGHAISTNYLQLHDSGGESVQATWDLGAADLHWALGLDGNGDGRVVWSEIESRRDAIAALAAANLRIRRNGTVCPVHLDDLLLTQHAGEPSISLQLHATCPAGSHLEVASTLFAQQDASQKTLLDATTTVGSFTTVLAPTGVAWVAPRSTSWLATFLEFVGQGTWHVWIGYDHIAFLLLLLLPSVLRRSPQGWSAAPSGRRAVHDLLIIVTAFTVAHSITLALAATGTARPPVRLIEASIAFSIVAAGVLNLSPGAARWRLALAFGFGLMHGFGFANALAELGARGAHLVPALAGFNVGVELAQLSIVLLVFPALLRARACNFYQLRFMPAMSIAVAMAGAVWFAQRV